MVKKKNRDTLITVAIIGAIGAIIAGYYQGPLADTQWKERPFVFLTLGNEDLELPSEQLARNNFGYYVDVVVWNEGKSHGKILLGAQGVQAMVSFEDRPKNWYEDTSRPFTIFANPEKRTIPMYVLPEENSNEFTVTFFATDDLQFKPPFQEIGIFAPVSLTFEKTEEGYKLTDSQ